MSNSDLWIDVSLETGLKPYYSNDRDIKRVRSIIFCNDEIILIKRERIENGKKLLYYVFPGGGAEKGETLEQALHREIFEELGIKVKILKKLYLSRYKDQNNLYFFCKYLSGELGTGQGPEFNDESYSNKGSYNVMTFPVSKISDINLVPNSIRDKLLFDLRTGALRN